MTLADDVRKAGSLVWHEDDSQEREITKKLGVVLTESDLVKTPHPLDTHVCPYYQWCDLHKIPSVNIKCNEYKDCRSYKMVHKYQDEMLVRFKNGL